MNDDNFISNEILKIDSEPLTDKMIIKNKTMLDKEEFVPYKLSYFTNLEFIKLNKGNFTHGEDMNYLNYLYPTTNFIHELINLLLSRYETGCRIRTILNRHLIRNGGIINKIKNGDGLNGILIDRHERPDAIYIDKINKVVYSYEQFTIDSNFGPNNNPNYYSITKNNKVDMLDLIAIGTKKTFFKSNLILNPENNIKDMSFSGHISNNSSNQLVKSLKRVTNKHERKIPNYDETIKNTLKNENILDSESYSIKHSFVIDLRRVNLIHNNIHLRDSYTDPTNFDSLGAFLYQTKDFISNLLDKNIVISFIYPIAVYESDTIIEHELDYRMVWFEDREQLSKFFIKHNIKNKLKTSDRTNILTNNLLNVDLRSENILYHSNIPEEIVTFVSDEMFQNIKANIGLDKQIYSTKVSSNFLHSDRQYNNETSKRNPIYTKSELLKLSLVSNLSEYNKTRHPRNWIKESSMLFIANDNKISRDFLRDALKEEGYNNIVVFNGVMMKDFIYTEKIFNELFDKGELTNLEKIENCSSIIKRNMEELCGYLNNAGLEDDSLYSTISWLKSNIDYNTNLMSDIGSKFAKVSFDNSLIHTYLAPYINPMYVMRMYENIEEYDMDITLNSKPIRN